MLDQQATPLGESSTMASTRGWDTVYAVTFDKVNSAIAQAQSSPDDFDEPGEDGESLTGIFGDWALTSGAGHLLGMSLPVPELTLKLRDLAGDLQTYVRQGVTIDISLQLDCVPQPDTDDRANKTDKSGLITGGQMHEFRVRLPQRAPLANRLGAVSAVAVLNVTYPAMSGAHTQPASTDPAEQENVAAINLMFTSWINDPLNLGEFNHAFAAVNLNGRISEKTREEQGDFTWLLPVHTTYSVISEGSATGIFAVLCMCDDPEDGAEPRPVPTTTDISPTAIPEGQSAAFLISKERFLSKLILPGAATSFAKPEGDDSGAQWPADYFEVVASGNMIRNTRPLEMPDFKGREKDKPSTASLPANGFNLTFEDHYLEIRYQDFKHPFWWFWYEANHTFSTKLDVALDPQSRFSLIPLADDDTAFHSATLTKTSTGQVVDTVLLVVDILTILAPFAAAGWGVMAKTAPKVAAETTEASVKIASKTAKGSAEAGGKIIAAGAKELTKKGGSGLSALMSTKVAALWGGATAVMSGVLIVDQIYQLAADGSDAAKNRLPDFREFAAKVMAPVEWPASDALDVQTIALNGAFQVAGEPVNEGPSGADT
ncbi:TULIP family P47-like protein [Litorivita sp. NS0012-18]|uniref:TULIP family P47-like protein n=1 Tax=Litorivita sp. NS0012-18 TaxID=3127655 RepID=UPI0031026DC1